MPSHATITPGLHRVTAEQTALWLARGWRDMARHPGISLGVGAVVAAVGAAMTVLLVRLDVGSLVLPLASAFTLVGPLAAVCLYEVSRRIETGEKVSPALVLAAVRARGGQIANIGLVLTLALAVWLLAGLVVFALFHTGPVPPLDGFVAGILFDPGAVPFLLTGTLVGGAIAAVTFSVSVFAVPMLLDREISAVAAMAASLRAVRANWRNMIGWAATIAVIIAFGFATLFVGLIVGFPLLAHASWHAYRDVIG
jgi:uncharacterized membrane protein